MYTPPTITASGITTLAGLQKAGLSGILEALITANGNLTATQIGLIRKVKNGNLQDVYRRAATVVTNFDAGNPVAVAGAEATLLDAHTVFLVLAEACLEAGTVFDGNQGHIADVPTGIGGREPQRLWP